MAGYCNFAVKNPLHRDYHDKEYGFPKDDEQALFELLILEINQAGLSWDLMLRKRATMLSAYEGYIIDRIAGYDDQDRARLLSDSGIIRNRLKIEATIYNALMIQGMRRSHGGFADWLRAHHPLRCEAWVRLFRQTFRFTGAEIVNEFLMSIGYLPFAHDADCPIGAAIRNAPWQEVGVEFYAPDAE